MAEEKINETFPSNVDEDRLGIDDLDDVSAPLGAISADERRELNEQIKLLKSQLENSRSSESGGGVTVISKHRPQPQNKPPMVFQASSGLGIAEILAHAQAIKNYSANNFAVNPFDTVIIKLPRIRLTRT
jgi:hypothetical protein